MLDASEGVGPSPGRLPGGGEQQTVSACEPGMWGSAPPCLQLRLAPPSVQHGHCCPHWRALAQWPLPRDWTVGDGGIGCQSSLWLRSHIYSLEQHRFILLPSEVRNPDLYSLCLKVRGLAASLLLLLQSLSVTGCVCPGPGRGHRQAGDSVLPATERRSQPVEGHFLLLQQQQQQHWVQEL